MYCPSFRVDMFSPSETLSHHRANIHPPHVETASTWSDQIREALGLVFAVMGHSTVPLHPQDGQTPVSRVSVCLCPILSSAHAVAFATCCTFSRRAVVETWRETVVTRSSVIPGHGLWESFPLRLRCWKQNMLPSEDNMYADVS